MDMGGGRATKGPERESQAELKTCEIRAGVGTSAYETRVNLESSPRPQPVDRPRRLYRTVIKVWTDTPTDDLDFADLAQQVEREEAYAQVVSGGWVSNPAEFPQTDLFGNPEREVS